MKIGELISKNGNHNGLQLNIKFNKIINAGRFMTVSINDEIFRKCSEADLHINTHVIFFNNDYITHK